MPDQQVSMPMVVLPIVMFNGVVPSQDGSLVVMVTARSPAGAQLQGFLSGENAESLGQQLVTMGRECHAKRLMVPPANGKLITPNGQALHVVPDPEEPE